MQEFQQIDLNELAPGEMAFIDRQYKMIEDLFDNIVHNYTHYLDEMDGVSPHPIAFPKEFLDNLEELARDGGMPTLMALVQVAIVHAGTAAWHPGWQCERVDMDPGEWVDPQGNPL